jgi:AcrR family transcriptional regulator
MDVKQCKDARPDKVERDKIKRTQILEATKLCVIQHGFHAASMALIAESSNMSVGQIYRYFKNKEAIVLALVDNITEVKINWIVQTAGSLKLDQILVDRLFNPTLTLLQDNTLRIEITSEAHRNPAVAEIVKEADKRIHQAAEKIVKQDFPQFSNSEVAARVELIAILSEGINFRQLFDKSDYEEELKTLFRNVVNTLFYKVAKNE